MRKFVSLVFLCYILIFTNTACSEQLGGVKGKVINALTKMPISDAAVIAITETNIESEQRYKKVTTKTSKDGSFTIKGLRNKEYTLSFKKEGYYADDISERIPEKSNALMEKPVNLCPIPSQGVGVYLYTDHFVKLNHMAPKINPNRGVGIAPTAYYDKQMLDGISPSSPKYLMLYGINTYGNWFLSRLYRAISPFEAVITTDAADGNIYSLSNSANFYGRYGIYKLNWQNSRAIFSNSKIEIHDINNLSEGYYYVGDDVLYINDAVPPKGAFVFLKKEIIKTN